jgi:cell division protein FtsB
VVEFSVPLAASTFVALWRYDALSLPRILGLWLFLTVVFLLGGKLFLSAIPRTATLFHMARRTWRLKRMERKHEKELKARGDSLRKKLDQLDEEEEALESERDGLESPAALEKLRERKVQLFLSEYELVRRAVENGVISPDVVRAETQS